MGSTAGGCGRKLGRSGRGCAVSLGFRENLSVRWREQHVPRYACGWVGRHVREAVAECKLQRAGPGDGERLGSLVLQSLEEVQRLNDGGHASSRWSQNRRASVASANRPVVAVGPVRG